MSQPPSKSQRVELPVFEYSDSDDDSGSDTDFNNIQYYEPEVDPIALTMLETLDRRRRARDNVGDDLIVHLVDEIPLEADAPVGYRSQKRNRLRRLHKKGDLEDDDLSDDDDEVNIDKAFDDGGDLEEEIERDRAKIEEAARSMGLRPKSVIIHRSEEIITVDPMGEAAVEGELVLSLSSQQKAKAKAPLPGVDAEDEMEYISGDQLGAKDVERQFEDVTETRLMWRVPNMKTPLRTWTLFPTFGTVLLTLTS